MVDENFISGIYRVVISLSDKINMSDAFKANHVSSIDERLLAHLSFIVT